MQLQGEQLWQAVWLNTYDFIGFIMALVMVLIIAIMIYDWFRFKP